MSNNIINFKKFKKKKEDQLFDLLFENFQNNNFNISLEVDFMKLITLEEETIKQANNININKLVDLQLKSF